MNIGDKVKVIDIGVDFPSYTEKFRSMNFKSVLNKDGFHNYFFDKNTIFTVFSKGFHEGYQINLYGIESEKGYQFLFSEDGLEKVKENPIDVKSNNSYYPNFLDLEVSGSLLEKVPFPIVLAIKNSESNIEEYIAMNKEGVKDLIIKLTNLLY